MADRQFSLFDSPPEGPEGLRYQPEFVSEVEAQKLVGHLQSLPFAPFAFQSFLGKRRTVSFGWHYRFDGGGLAKAEEVPPFLHDLRARAEAFAELPPGAFRHVLVIEYEAGAGIGWHRDRPVFDKVVGLSLLAPARMRFRRKREDGWERFALIAEPRSAYLLDGPARNEWEHSIPPMETLRYSITFRNFRPGKEPI